MGFRRPRVFPSLCDWLDDEVPIEWLADFLKLIQDTPNLDWLLLTKRPENFWKRINDVFEHPPAIGLSRWLESFDRFGLPEHIWIGTSVEDQKRADERIPELLAIPAKVRFLSVEPLLGPVDLAYSCFNGADSLGSMPGIHWVIVGGESGPGARPCNIEWIRSIQRACHYARTSVFVKQLGSSVRGPAQHEGTHREYILHHPKGGDPEEWPHDLRVREFPSRNSKLETA